jgi:ribosomal protein S9
MTKNYNYAVGRRKGTTAVVKLFGGGKGTISIKKPNGKEVSIQEYFGGNTHMLDNALMAFDVL